MPFSKISIDSISFWVGAAVASAFWWMLKLALPLFQQIRGKWQKKQEAATMRGASSIESHYRERVLQKAQGMHLAAPLFSLEEIILPPVFLAPPPQVEPGSEIIFSQDQTNLTIPYLPQDSTLASFYQTETLAIPEALSGETHLVIVGESGVGKTVALAQIASLMARRDPSVGMLGKYIPFHLHIADLNLQEKDLSDILEPIAEFVTEGASLFDSPRLPKFTRLSFSSGRALLLLDGLDEIPREEVKKVTRYLTKLLKEYPRTRIITTGSLDYLDNLIQIGFAPLTLRRWGIAEQDEFLDKWGNLWKSHVALEAWVQAGPEQVDPILLNTWLHLDAATLSPLEITLKTWGAYAGDGRGATPLAAIETHLRRISPNDIPIAALEALAMQASLNTRPVFDSRQARTWIKSFEPPEEVLFEGGEDAEGDDVVEKKEKVTHKRGLLDKMAQSGLLIEHRDSQMRFAHPVFSGFLAGRSLSNYTVDERLTGQPFWTGKTLAMHYLAANGGSASSLVETLLGTPDPVLERNLISMGGWLRDAPRKSAWRGKVMMSLATTLQDDTQPLGLRGQIVSVLARSGDPSVAALFRQLLQSQSAYVIQLAALGSGLMRDKKAAQPLSETLQRMRNTYTLCAACLALSAIGTDTALNAIASALMQGEENLRRAAAEAFATHPAEGWGTLKEALEIDDILVRRSAVYGLARIQEPWAKELLAHIQIEDKEWAVRDIAANILEKAQNKNLQIPQKLPAPSESPWLIAFAGKEGVGISAGAPATDVLLLALKSEDVDEQLAALAYLRRTPSEGVINSLYHAMYGSNIEMREAVFLALVEIAASGVSLPEPQSYGLA